MLTAALPLAVRAHATHERAGIALATSRGTVRIECATNRPHRELVEAAAVMCVLDAARRSDAGGGATAVEADRWWQLVRR